MEPFSNKELYHCGWIPYVYMKILHHRLKFSSIYGKNSFHAKLYHDIKYN